jgi:hypothetical protein
MRPWLVVLCACNQVLGIDHTTHPLDAPIDAPFACPQLGKSLQFSPTPVMLQITQCQEYTTSRVADLALAYCYTPQNAFVEQGPVDGALNPVPELAPGNNSYTKPRVSPEGDQLVTLAFGNPGGFLRYRRSGTSWNADASAFTMPAQITLNDQVVMLSTPSRGPNRRMLALIDKAGATAIDELSDDASDTLGFVKEYTPAGFGLMAAEGPMLSPDGLRAVLRGVSADSTKVGVWYMDRPSITSDFGTPQLVPGIPDITDPFLTEDCGRMYFSTGGSIWYAQQM